MKIIAEIGSNHLGRFESGKKVIDEFNNIGCNLMKMQLWKADDLYKNTDIYLETQRLELKYDLAKQFYDYCKDKGIELFFSVFNEEAVDFCEDIGVKYYKVAARVDDENLLRKIGETEKDTFISFDNNLNGKKSLKIRKNFFEESKVIPLYTVSEYPPQPKSFDINSLKSAILMGGGYSNHYQSPLYCMLAKQLCASYIEIHIRLKSLPDTPDSVCSWDLDKLKRFIGD